LNQVFAIQAGLGFLGISCAMNRKSASKGGRSKRAAWSGGGSREAPRHRWQDPNAASRGRLTNLPRPNRWFVTVVTALGLLAFLVFLVLMRPVPTPLIVVAATNYEIPIPINGWALEDSNALAELGYLDVIDLSEKWNEGSCSVEDIIPTEEFTVPRSAPLIVYISMHGIVTDEGEPCLLPPHASIHDAKNWIRVAGVLEKLESLAPERNKLLILDCSRIRVNWNLGILYNSFAERVDQLVRKRTTGQSGQQLAVLISAGPGQTSWTSADLGGSAFGRFLQLGLAGAADQDSGFAWSRDVTLSELNAYLQREIPVWSVANRGEPQTPVLLPAGVDFHLTYCNRSAAVRRAPKALGLDISLDDLVPLWDQLDTLRSAHELVRWDPIACRDLERKLLRVEELAQGGAAYAEPANDTDKSQAKELLEELRDELKQISERADKAGNSLGSQLDISSNGNWARLPDAAHSLPASEYFGACEPERAESVRKVWDAIGQPDANLEALNTEGVDKGELAWSLFETQVLASAWKQQVFKLWSSSYDVLKTLQALRNTAEGLAVPRLNNGRPGDERANYYTRLLANEADIRRRLAEDILFVGERNAGDGRYDKLATEARGLYERTRVISNDTAIDLKVQDAALAETPYLAAWLCNPLSIHLAGRDKLIEEELIPFIQQTRQLGQEIGQHIDDPDYLPKTGHPPFHAIASRVRSQHQDVLKKAFDDELANLTTGLEDAQRLRAIEAALAVPLIPGKTRIELLAQRAEIATALHTEYFNSATDASPVPADEIDLRSGQESGDQSASSFVELVTNNWKRHPLLEILQIDPPSATAPEQWCEKAGAEARAELAEIRGTKSGNPPVTPAGSIASGRKELSDDERRLRAIAALSHGTVEESDNPIAKLRRYDVQQLLIWLGRRAMDEFWVGITDRGNEPPFFARAAEDFFASAEMLSTSATVQIDDSRGLLAKRWDSRASDSVGKDSKRIKIEADSNLLMAPGDDATVSIKVAPNSAVIADFPQGVAALYLRSGTERQSDVTIKGLPPISKSYMEMPAQGDVQGFSAVVRDAARIDVLEAAAFFRGREDVSQIIVPNLAGRLIVYPPNRYNSQSITLIGDEQQRLSIMFIVDCSGSMAEQTLDSPEVGGVSTKSRMELAKEAVNTMLHELARRNANKEDIQIGVRLYGHRFAWRQYAPFTYMRNVDYLEHRPSKDLAPSSDIELIHPIGRFDDTHAKNVRVLLERVKPWGLTPFFRALEESLSDFARVDPKSRPAIIAITDGEDRQWAPDNSSVPEPRPTTKEDVLEAWSQYRIPIHILGFDLRAGDNFSITAAEAQKAKTDYQEIANRTGGLFSGVSSGTELLRELQSRLAPGDYFVREVLARPGGTTSAPRSKTVNLNESVGIRLRSRQPKEFEVDFRGVSRKVVLEGGEAIQLRLAEGGRDIVAVEYPSSIQRELVANGDTRVQDFMLLIQRPRKNQDSVNFQFALQRDPALHHFTKRPVETWVEIMPRSDDGVKEEPYVFYDRNFEPDTPVPVLEWVATNWPAGANKAWVRFWCKYTATPSETFSLREVIDAPAKFRELSLNDLPGIQFKIEASDSPEPLIYVEESHKKGSPVSDSARVQFESDQGILPKIVKHQFDREHGIVTHSFSFSKVEVPNLDKLGSARISIASAQKVKEGSLHLPENERVEVEIASDDALFSPAATRNSR
jgi:Mg-chelatase subunit ChlD